MRFDRQAGRRRSDRPQSSRPVVPGADLSRRCRRAEETIPKDTPPAFLCAAADDAVPTGTALALSRNCATPAIAAELHLFANGRPRIRHEGPPASRHGWSVAVPRVDARIRHFWQPSPPMHNKQCKLRFSVIELGRFGLLCHDRHLPRAPSRSDRYFATRRSPAPGPRTHIRRHRPPVSSGLLHRLPRRRPDRRALRPAQVHRYRRSRRRPGALVDRARAPEQRDDAAAKARSSPTAGARQAVVAWIGALRNEQARKNAGDPGPVLARRLSNAEYDYTIRDLTGVDIRPTREFPVDPANEAGFDNSAESLAMSPALLKKYLQAAREVADHLVLKPDGLRLRAAPGGRRHRPRQVLRQPDHRLLPAAADRLRRLLPRRLALPAPRGARPARRRRWPTFAAEAGSARSTWRRSGRRSTEPPEDDRPARRAAGDVARAARRRRATGRRPGRLRADARLRRRSCAQKLVPAVHEPDRRRASRTARSRSCCGRTASMRPTARLRPRALQVEGEAPAPRSRRRPREGIDDGPAAAPLAPQRADADLHVPAGERAATRPPSPASAGLPRRLLRLGARPRLPRPSRRRATRPAAQRRLPQHDGLLPRRRAALRADPRRRPAAASSTPLAGVRLRHRRPDAAVHELHLVRADRRRGSCATPSSTSPAPRTRTSTSEAQDRASSPRSTWPRPARRGERRRRIEAIETTSAIIDDEHPPGREARVDGRAEPPRGAARRSPSGPTAGRSSPAERDDLAAFYRDAARAGRARATRTPSATRVVSVLMSPHFCYRVDLPGRAGRGRRGRCRTTRWPAG